MSPLRIDSIPRVPLAALPSPVHPLSRLSSALGGPQIWIKRDDLTGLATGGNKTRKLEFLIADAMQQGKDTVITAGGPQSNHCRQTAAAAARYGLECHLVLGGAATAEPPRGNLLLDHLLAARIHWVEKSHRTTRMESLAEELAAAGRRPYVIPIGGSNAVGAAGYVVAMVELCEQLAAAGKSIDRIVVATSSGGTQAGLVLGAAVTRFHGRITAVSIDQLPDGEDPAGEFRQHVAAVANDTAAWLGIEHRVPVSAIEVDYDYLGGGYGVVGSLERDAIRLVAGLEGILLGPVYTGRGMGGLIDKVRRGGYPAQENILYWHTGDESALHAYAAELV